MPQQQNEAARKSAMMPQRSTALYQILKTAMMQQRSTALYQILKSATMPQHSSALYRYQDKEEDGDNHTIASPNAPGNTTRRPTVTSAHR